MINRVLIRLKIVQIIYAYYQNGNKNIDTAEKELFFSLSKAYDLYNYLLLLIVEITRHAQKKIDLAQNRLTPTKEDMTPHIKLAENKFAMQLEANQQLDDFANNQKKNWAEGQEFIKKLYEEIISSSIYKEYLAIEAPAYTDDRELWRKLYKTFIFNNEELDQLLEDQSLYWNDDKAIVELQREYDEFKVNVPVYSVNGDGTVDVKIGLKEGVNSRSVYEVLMKDVSSGVTQYKRVGLLKAIPGKIWDNRFGAMEEAIMLEQEGVAEDSTADNTARQPEEDSVEAGNAFLDATTFQIMSGANEIVPGLLIREMKIDREKQ